MAERVTSTAAGGEAGRVLDGGFRLVVLVVVAFSVLVASSVLWGGSTSGGAVAPASPSSASAASANPGASAGVNGFLAAGVRAAPPIELTDQDGQAFSLASLRGSPALVFFGYTHCTDVCPATVGTIGKAMATAGVGARAVFVTVDPERDTGTWLKEYVTYLPAGFVALTGTDDRIRTTADAWGVRYARVETGVPNGYSMAHTADVYLVDAAGSLRATFPFGTGPETMAAVLRTMVAEPSGAPPTPASTLASASGAPTATPLTGGTDASGSSAVGLQVTVVSTSVWSGPASPIILSLSTAGIPIGQTDLHPSVQLLTSAGEPTGTAVGAVPVQPPGVPTVSYVATVAIPSPGSWRLSVTIPLGSRQGAGTVDVTALDPGTTAPIGSTAPTAHTPTLTDVGGLAKAITTDPAPDLRLSQRSTTDALADHQPFVLVVDSTKFRVSPACGRAIIMARYMLDRWPQAGFIHLEPYRYSIITDTPVLDGSLADPTLTDPAAAWGIGGDPWGARSMPWVFLVDGSGVVRAKYQGVMSSDDVDVIMSLIEQGG